MARNFVNYETLYAEHRRQDRHKAVGVDRITKVEYEKNLDENLENHVRRMKSFSYRPQPVRRVEIPKANGKTRDTFDFLGFTHVNSKTRNGKYTVGHKVSKKKKKQFKSNLKKWVKENRNMEFMTFMPKMNRKLIGTNNYYSVSESIREARGLYCMPMHSG